LLHPIGKSIFTPEGNQKWRDTDVKVLSFKKQESTLDAFNLLDKYEIRTTASDIISTVTLDEEKVLYKL